MMTKQDRDSWFEVLQDRILRQVAVDMTRELAKDECNDEMAHSWKPHEVVIIDQLCEQLGLSASLFDSDMHDPVAAFLSKDCDEAIASVARSGGRYLVLDSEGRLIKEGPSLLGVLTETIHNKDVKTRT